MICAICGATADLWRNVDGYDYSDCTECGCIALDPFAMSQLDAGTFPRQYDSDYWMVETLAAKQRSWAGTLARVAETILYCRRPIERFVDIGTGPGFLLDALSTYLPDSASKFYGVEMFPPAEHSNHPNYTIGHIRDAKVKFDAGVCIEVIEHLTPTMLEGLAKGIAERSNPEAVYLINTALPHFVKDQVPDYIDPLRRGHIVSWSLLTIERIFGRHGFTVWPLPGKDWAFMLEYQSSCDETMIDRIWNPLPENASILQDSKMGSPLYVLGLETARAYQV